MTICSEIEKSHKTLANNFQMKSALASVNFLLFSLTKLTSCSLLKFECTWHTAYSWNIMCQKWEGNCGLWVLNEMILKKYAESLKKIMGAVWELPAK